MKAFTPPGHTNYTEILITRIRNKECRTYLERMGFGRLACSSNNRPFIVPVYFVYDRERLYCFSTLRQKIKWMRENPLICVEADEIRARDDWTTVIAFGRYVEIPNTPDNRKGREYARSLVQRRSQWWQSGYTITQLRSQPKPPFPVFYCILIENLTGVRASPDISESSKRRPGLSPKE